MPKNKTYYVCSNCGHIVPKWEGRCNSCNQWNTFEERVEDTNKNTYSLNLSNMEMPKKLKDIKNSTKDRYITKISEFNRVLGGGLVTDSIIAIAASPGSGKSTLFGQVSIDMAENEKTVLYVSGEESEGQVKDRILRLSNGKIPDNIYIIHETCIEKINHYVKILKPNLLVIDSIQKIHSIELPDKISGGPSQIKKCSKILMDIAKKEKTAVLIVSHVNKNEELAGIIEFEHDVDVVLYLEGDRTQQLRILRSKKNRFGSTDEVGLFTMSSKGLIPIENPTKYFVTNRDDDIIGAALSLTVEGTRPLIVEIESLVDNSNYGNPLRTSEGINKQKLQILTAIIEKRVGFKLSFKNVYMQISGGLKINEPAINLAIIAAICSSYTNKPLSSKHLYIGEVGLTGKIKPVPQIEKRLKEADRLGFKKAYIPKNSLSENLNLKHLEIVEVDDVYNLFKIIFDIK